MMTTPNVTTLMKKERVPLTQVGDLAEDLAKELAQHRRFCLWLIGEIGSGKTFLTGKILNALGHPPSDPVSSPTFTYLNDYEVNGKHFGHLDFYRADSKLSLVLDILDDYDFDGLFIEWPEVIKTKDARILPTHILEITKSVDLFTRDYELLRTVAAR